MLRIWLVSYLGECVLQRLQIIASSVSGLPSDARIIDVGSGTGCLIPHLKALGLSNILAVDLSPKMLSELEKEFPNPGTLGNDLGISANHSKFSGASMRSLTDSVCY